MCVIPKLPRRCARPGSAVWISWDDASCSSAVQLGIEGIELVAARRPRQPSTRRDDAEPTDLRGEVLLYGKSGPTPVPARAIAPSRGSRESVRGARPPDSSADRAAEHEPHAHRHSEHFRDEGTVATERRYRCESMAGALEQFAAPLAEPGDHRRRGNERYYAHLRHRAPRHLRRHVTREHASHHVDRGDRTGRDCARNEPVLGSPQGNCDDEDPTGDDETRQCRL